MGREAVCSCEWGGETAACKVLLETDALITRGPLRRKVLLASITEARVDGDLLRFCAGAERVALRLGAKQAQSWLKALTKPPVTLAAKLGVKPGMEILVLGEAGPEALREALCDAFQYPLRDAPAATRAGEKAPDLIVLCAESVAGMERDLTRALAFREQPPIWVVYPKGAGKMAASGLGEGQVRERMRGLGWMDTKVAAVDGVYTALRFVRRGV